MGVITTYGFLWERKYLFRGKGRSAGHLIGFNKTNVQVDFREQIGIYVLYDKNQYPIYIGQAGGREKSRLLKRLKDHEIDHLWNRWEYFSWFGVRKINSSNNRLAKYDTPSKSLNHSIADIINDLEGILLVGIEPKLNKQGPRWNGEEFYQFIDDRMVNYDNSDIFEKLSSIQNLLEGKK